MHDWNDDRIYQRACVGLVEAGHEVSLVATHESSSAFVSQGVNILPIQKRSGIKRRILSSREAMKKAKASTWDVLMFHDPDLLPWMLLLSFSRKGIVYDIHENYNARIESGPIPSFLKPLFMWLFRWFETFCINRFSGFTTTTETMGRMFKGANKKYCVTSNMPYMKILPTGLEAIEKTDYPSVYISGTHSPARNCTEIVQALPEVAAAIPDVKFIFVGRYHPEGYKEQLFEIANTAGVAKNLVLDGNLPWLENFKRTATMQVGLVFYQDNLNNRVTIPNRLFEYMACRCAVVGEYFDEVKKVIDTAQCGATVDSSKPSEIAKALIHVLSDKNAIANYGNNARKAVEEKFSFEIELKRMIAYFEDIVKSNH
jgi:glycosyltransferase involved in cell wall biosynthesis